MGSGIGPLHNPIELFRGLSPQTSVRILNECPAPVGWQSVGNIRTAIYHFRVPSLCLNPSSVSFNHYKVIRFVFSPAFRAILIFIRAEVPLVASSLSANLVPVRKLAVSIRSRLEVHQLRKLK